MTGWRTRAISKAMRRMRHKIVGDAPLAKQGLLTTTLAEELEMLAKDCEDTARAAMLLTLAQSTAESAEARAWLSVAYRIRHIAKRLTQ